jgi:hypothetical protein
MIWSSIHRACGGLPAIVIVVLCCGCGETAFRAGPSQDGLARAGALKTANRANEVARTVLTSPARHPLTFDAFLVGVEKGNAKRVGAPPLRGVDREALPRPEARGKLRGFLNDPRAMFVSHIVEFQTAGGGGGGGGADAAAAAAASAVPVPLYNAYDAAGAQVDAGSPVPGSAWSDADAAIDQLRERVAAVVAERRSTHLILWATGWNNTQFETTSSLQELHDSLRAAAAADGRADEFRPLFVAISWSSYWPGLPGEAARVSLRTKSNDADEVGIVVAGRVIGRVLVPVSDAAAGRPKVVVVGHSLGARVVTWGAVSAASGMTGTPPAGRPVDLVVGLQGAFSANAFVVEGGKPGGRDGAPFAEFRSASKRLMYTSSDLDIMRFLPLAYIGKVPVHERFAGEHPGTFDRRRVTSAARQVPATTDGPLPSGDGWDRVLLVDASSVIADHNDVRNPAVGSLLWQAMR